MNEETFKRASEIQVTLHRIDKVLEAASERGSMVINSEHFSIKHPLGAAVLAEVEKYKLQLADEFNKL